MSREGFIDVEVPPQAAWWWSQPVSVLPLQSPITVSDHVSSTGGGWKSIHVHVYMGSEWLSATCAVTSAYVVLVMALLALQVTCGEAVKLLQEKQIDQVPILTDTGYNL